MTDAGQGQVPVGQLLGQQPHRPSRWRALVQWRSWSIPVKLSATPGTIRRPAPLLGQHTAEILAELDG